MSNDFTELTLFDLEPVSGGAGDTPSFADIRAKAAPYCPVTAEKYGNLDPSSITRTKAQKMGNECLTEMGPLYAGFAKPKIDHAINEAFPAKK